MVRVNCQNGDGGGSWVSDSSEKLLILLRDRPCLDLIIISSNFQAFLFLQTITGISLTQINSSKKVLKITGRALSRINSIIVSAQTLFSVELIGVIDLTLPLTQKLKRSETI